MHRLIYRHDLPRPFALRTRCMPCRLPPHRTLQQQARNTPFWQQNPIAVPADSTTLGHIKERLRR